LTDEMRAVLLFTLATEGAENAIRDQCEFLAKNRLLSLPSYVKKKTELCPAYLLIPDGDIKVLLWWLR